MRHLAATHVGKQRQESKTPDDFYDVVIGNWPLLRA